MSTAVALAYSVMMMVVFVPLGPEWMPAGAALIAIGWLVWLLTRPRAEPAQPATPSQAHAHDSRAEQPRAKMPSTDARPVRGDAAWPRREHAGGSTVPRRGTVERGAHFRRHERTPGWLYVARNDRHAENLFKVGYTTRRPGARVRDFDREAKGMTWAVGWWSVVHAVEVPRSYEAEQLAFAKLRPYRVSAGREFFEAPLATIIEAVNTVAASMTPVRLAPALRFATCPGCGRAQQFSTADQVAEVELLCAPCGTRWSAAVGSPDE